MPSPLIRRSPALAFILVVLTVAPALSQRDSATPEQVAAQYMRAMKAQHWDSMALLMHPYALHQMRQLLAPLFEAPSLDGPREELLGVHSLAEARALTDTAVFAALISRLMSSQAQITEFLHDATLQVIGHVAEGPDTVHVVYRMSYQKGEAAISKMDVVSMLRMGNTWRALLSADLRMLGAMLRRQAGT